MNSGIIEFVRSGSIGEISLGTSKSRVAEVFGVPGLWEGQGKWTVNESDIWRFGAIQVNFDNDQVSSMIVHTGRGDGPESATDISVGTFYGVKDLELLTIEAFEEFLQSSGVAYERDIDMSRRTIIRMSSGVVAAFGCRSDYHRSLAEGRWIGSSVPGLVSLRVAVN